MTKFPFECKADPSSSTSNCFGQLSSALKSNQKSLIFKKAMKRRNEISSLDFHHYRRKSELLRALKIPQQLLDIQDWN